MELNEKQSIVVKYLFEELQEYIEGQDVWVNNGDIGKQHSYDMNEISARLYKLEKLIFPSKD